MTSDKVQIIKGLVLLIAVGIDVYSHRRGGLSLIGRLFGGGGRTAAADSAAAEQPAVVPSSEPAEDSSRSLTT